MTRFARLVACFVLVSTPLMVQMLEHQAQSQRGR